MDVLREYWSNRISNAWKNNPIVWLAGVRRSGKTTLAEGMTDSVLINCDLPSSRALLRDPETFYERAKTGTVILDEIHQLENPSEVLKIGADRYGRRLRILATGSSTLSATNKFKDSLTGRKRTVHLVPVLPEECRSFGVKDITERMCKGGLPPALMSKAYDPEFYSEWIDSFYARDVQEIFRVEKRQPFIHLLELLLQQNSGLAELSQLAKEIGLSRPTVSRYLEALETTQAITVLRPFHGGGRQELVSQPKIYGFDTGFVAFSRGWTELRPEDCGHLLENLVLESLQAIPYLRGIFFWRTKQQKEIDFIVPVDRDRVHAIECKWKADQFDAGALKVFRQDYPKGENFVVSSDSHLHSTGRSGNLRIRYLSIEEFRSEFEKHTKGTVKA